MNGTVDVTVLRAHLGNWSRGPGPLYLRLADALERAIERGDLPPGIRLPAERVLAGSVALSRGTVMAAYERLRELGLLDSRIGSGSWVRLDAGRPVSVLNDGEPAATPRPSARLFEDRCGIIDLATNAVAGMGAIPHEFLVPPATDVLERLADGHGYQPLGLPALRERVAAHFGAGGLPTSAGSVAVTTGAQQAITLVAALVLKPGDAVIVESPTYPGAIDAFNRAGARILTVPAERAWVRTSVLEDAIKRHGARMVYLMPGCHNPLGRAMSESRRREIAALADRHAVFVLEDNALAGTTFDCRPVPPVAAFSTSGRVLTVGSLSKVGWGGLRVGWVCGPEPFIERLGRLKAAADFGASALPQLVACRILESYPAIAGPRVTELRERLAVLEAELRRLLPSWSWASPHGGANLWVRLPCGRADEFAQLALRHGVDVVPGSAYTVDDCQADHLSVAFARPPEVLRQGVQRLARAWAAYVHGSRAPVACRAG